MKTLIAILLLALPCWAGPQEISAADKKKAGDLRAAVDKAPDDAGANLALGKLLCFTAGDWKEGLPFLAKGGDDPFAQVARKDLEPKENALFSIEVADGWLLLEQKNKPLQARIRERALFHFAEAWPKLNDPVWKDKTRERLRTLQQKGQESKTLGPSPANWAPAGTSGGVDRQYAHSGQSSFKIPGTEVTKKGPGAGISSEQFPCAAGAKIKYSCWVLSTGTETFDELRVKCRNAKQGAGEHLAMVAVKSTPDLPLWIRIDGETTAPEGTHSVEISFKRGGTGVGTVFLDDVSLLVDGKELLKNGAFEK